MTWDRDSAAISGLYDFLLQDGFVEVRPRRATGRRPSLRSGPSRDLRVRHMELEQYLYCRDVGSGGPAPDAQREAGVSRAIMNRATAALAEWDSRVEESPATVLDRQRREELSEVRGKLRKCRHECRQLQDQADAAATVITALLAENGAFHEQLAKRSALVIPLDRAHTIRE